MRVGMIVKPETVISGTSRYTNGIYQGLLEAGVDVHLTYPDPAPLPGPALGVLKNLGMDLETFFAGCPIHVKLDPADLYHIPSQTMATLLMFQRFPAPVVVTVLDIIPYLVRGDPVLDTSRHIIERSFYRLALAGLKRADALIAISHFTKSSLVEALGIPEERIHMVYPALDHEHFKPMKVPEDFRQKYKLSRGYRYILNVGSDDPRKNLTALVDAIALVRQQRADVRLLKIGAPHHMQERQRLLERVQRLGLVDEVQLVDQVEDDELPFFYNVADVFVMPSLLEGFGIPVAEAMACGVPVVCSSETAVPEVAGSAALLVSPRNPEKMAGEVSRVLEDDALAERMRKRGFEQAATFTSHRVTEGVIKVYSSVIA